MARNNFAIFYLVLIYCKSGSTSPVAVQSGATVVDEGAQHKDLNTFGVNSQQGLAGGRYAAGYSQQNEKKHTLAQDTGGYNNVNNNRNSHEDAGQYFGEKAHNQNAGSASQFGRQGGHRKGHHNSGFKNSYHKEESENNNSFYDDSDDQGGHFVYDSQNGGFHAAGLDRNQGSRNDGHLYAKENAQKGGYDKGGNFNKEQANKNGYNQNGFYNNQQNQGLQNAANAHGLGERHLQSRYYDQQPVYQTNYAPRRTITVYEDPRDLYPAPGYNSYREPLPYDSGLIHLNYQQNPYLQYPQNFNGYYY